MFYNLVILFGKNLEKNCANSRKNGNNNNLAKILRSQIRKKNKKAFLVNKLFFK
jgi:hypothetical protein